MQLRGALLTAQAEWTPASPPDVMTLLRLNSLQSDVVAKAAANRPYQRAVVAVLVICACVIALVSP